MQRLWFPAFLVGTLVACNSPNGGGGSSTGGSDTATGTTTGAPPPIGTLWVGGAGTVNPSSLADSGTLTQLDETCNPPGSGTALDGASAFDAKGNLWVSFPSGSAMDELIEWKSSDLQSCATRQPVVVSSMGFPLTAMAFDAAGNLWGTFLYPVGISDEVTGIALFKATDLAAGTASPQQFSSSGCGPLNALCDPTGLAFDSDGYLWVGSTYSVLAFSPKTLSGFVDGGAVVADRVITSPAAKAFDAGGVNPYYAHYTYLDPAFDAAGNLWVGVDDTEGNPIDHQIVEYSQAQLDNLDSDEDPTPVLVIHESAAQRKQLLISWGALAFDSQGNLWAGATQTAPNLWRYPSTSLTTQSPQADISITVPGDPSISLAFAPTPAGLPLH